MENTLSATGATIATVDQIGPYRLLREIASGAASTIYAAEDMHSRRPLAVKALKHDEQRSKDLRALTRLNRENLVCLHDVIETDETDYLVMELLNGETLESRLKREHRLPLKEAMRIAREAAAGLAFAHAHGLIHRDVCPANVWLEPSGRTRLLGLGLASAKDHDSLLERLGQAGAPSALSPEQAAGEPITQAADLFSLGALLYLMATGERPFRGEPPQALIRAVVFEHPKSARTIHPDIPEPLDELISRLLAKLPSGRPASAQEVEHRLVEWLDPTAPKPALLPPRLPEPFVYPASKRILESLNSARNEPGESIDAFLAIKAPFATVVEPPATAQNNKRRWLPDVIAAIILLAAATALFLWWKASNEKNAAPAATTTTLPHGAK